LGQGKIFGIFKKKLKSDSASLNLLNFNVDPKLIIILRLHINVRVLLFSVFRLVCLKLLPSLVPVMVEEGLTEGEYGAVRELVHELLNKAEEHRRSEFRTKNVQVGKNLEFLGKLRFLNHSNLEKIIFRFCKKRKYHSSSYQLLI
jgi:hypothetical protein